MQPRTQWPTRQVTCGRRLRRAAVLVACAAALAGCATPAVTYSPVVASMMPLEVKVLDTFGYTVSADVVRTDPTMALSAMPGDIFGTPRHTLQFVHITTRRMIEINADSLSIEIRPELASESAEFLIAGLSVEPRETGFARVAVGLMRKGVPAQGMAAGFVNALSYDPMKLFYFDRPCRVSGRMFNVGGALSPTTYAVDVRKAGLAWVVAIPQDGGGEIVVVANESAPKMFVAAPADNVRDGRFLIK